MIRKPFDENLFKSNDFKARDAAKDFLLFSGKVAKDNPDKYGPDLVLNDGSFIEVEIKHTWKNKFNFDSLQIPFRKEKFAKMNCTFMVFNFDCSEVFVVSGEDVLKSPVKEVKNKFIKGGEMFFQVPLELLKQYTVVL